MTSFIIGLDNDRVGVAARTLEQIESWPPGLPVFGQLTPFPSTPLYKRLEEAGRLTRPRHWLEFAPYRMAHTPMKMTIEETQRELDSAWRESYSSERNARAIEAIREEPINYRVIHLVMRLFFRGIYFPQMTKWAWMKVIAQNRRALMRLTREVMGLYLANRKRRASARDAGRPLPAINKEEA